MATICLCKPVITGLLGLKNPQGPVNFYLCMQQKVIDHSCVSLVTIDNSGGMQYRHLIIAPVDRTSPSAWM